MADSNQDADTPKQEKWDGPGQHAAFKAFEKASESARIKEQQEFDRRFWTAEAREEAAGIRDDFAILHEENDQDLKARSATIMGSHDWRYDSPEGNKAINEQLDKARADWRKNRDDLHKEREGWYTRIEDKQIDLKQTIDHSRQKTLDARAGWLKQLDDQSKKLLLEVSPNTQAWRDAQNRPHQPVEQATAPGPEKQPGADAPLKVDLTSGKETKGLVQLTMTHEQFQGIVATLKRAEALEQKGVAESTGKGEKAGAHGISVDDFSGSKGERLN